MLSQFLTLFLSIVFSTSLCLAVDRNLRPAADDSSQLADVYQDMIVVQQKAKEKAHKILFSLFGAIEFSDGPKAINALNLDFGYALSDSLEIYLNVAPVFFTQERRVSSLVSNLQLANGQQAALVSPDPKFQYGVELLWLPAYGKDSWGPYHIIRSDTFFKFSLGVTQFTSDSGLRGLLGIGKTFFLSPYLNPRISGSLAVEQTIVNAQKTTSEAGIFEFGSVWYF